MELYATKIEDSADSPEHHLSAVAYPGEWPLVLAGIEAHDTLADVTTASFLPDVITTVRQLDHHETSCMMQGLAYLARPLGVRALDSALRKAADFPAIGPALIRTLGASPRDIGTPSLELARAARRLRREALGSITAPTER